MKEIEKRQIRGLQVNCGVCKYFGIPPTAEPCKSCIEGEKWEPKFVPAFGIDDDERGPVLAVTRMPLETVIGYAIDGIKDHASKIGLRLTDKTLGEHELFDLIHDLANLHERWVALETERAEIQKAVEHVKNPDA